MALLYPRSKDLQSQVLEYFTVAVNLCHHLLDFTQKSAVRKFTSTLSDSDLKTFQSDLNHWAIAIKEETNVIEAQENSQFRALYSRRSKSATYQQKLATNLRVLDFCSKYDHQTTWKQTRKVGNTTLFTQFAEYQKWKDCSSSSTLLCTGKLGSGKSVLLANIVDDLNVYAQKDKIVIAYFFCRHDIPESLRARTILGSLARQVLRTIADLTMVVEVCEEAYSEACSIDDDEKVLRLLFRAFPPSHKAYFVLDGLDECERSERKALAQELQKLQETLKVLLCISFRIEPDTGLDSITEQFAATCIAMIPDDNPDIEAFIEADLESCLQNRQLVIGDPLLILEIQNALLKGSQGMFLWVALQIQSLCSMKTDEAIRDALADLPKDLSETFSRILRKLEQSEQPGQSYQTRILHLVSAASRPLTVDELREALSVIPGDTNWTPARLLNDVYSALACCGCLLSVDEEESTVRFIHHSVKQYLLNGFNNTNSTGFTVEKAQRTIADTVVTYLGFSVFGTELSRAKVPQVMIQTAPSGVIRATMGSSSTISSLAMKLLKSRKQPDFDISKTLAEARKAFQSRPVETFPFYSYAEAYWLNHIPYVSGQDRTMFNLSMKLIRSHILGANMAAKDYWMHWKWAAENGNETIIELLINSGKVDVDSKDNDGPTPLWIAVWYGYEAVVKLLLKTGKVDVDPKDKYGLTPLWIAASNGHEEVVKLLLDTGKVDVNLKDKDGQTPLWLAAWYGYEAIVKLLLDTGKVDVNLKDKGGRTPLWIAASNGNKAVVKLLLDTGKVDVELKDRDGRTPLWKAASGGYKVVVKLLLDTGKVDVNLKDKDERTPLWIAASNGNKAVVKLLLDTGTVDVDLMDKDGLTPLWKAASNGHEAVVKLLLDTGKVDVDLKDKDGLTPLWKASSNRHEAVVKLLLDTGKVDVNLKDKDGRMPLWKAASTGHEAVVKLLLDTGKVDVDLKDKDGRTPLWMVASNGHKAVVKLLLDTGKVDVDLKDKDGRMPLWLAASNGHEAVVKLLLDTGKVDVNLKDKDGRTPLWKAASTGQEAVVKLLLDTGKVDVDLMDKDGRTSLWMAASNGHETVVKLLLDTGKVDVDLKDKDGRTPLGWRH
jgi:ankyrin repeat protein